MLWDRPADELDDDLEASVMVSIEEEHCRVARDGLAVTSTSKPSSCGDDTHIF
jgi:hypothetical protein